MLKALLEDEQGMAAGLIRRPAATRAAPPRTPTPRSRRSRGQRLGRATDARFDNDTVRVLDSAEQVAQKAGDSYVTVERLLLALALAQTTAAGKALKTAGVTAEG